MMSLAKRAGVDNSCFLRGLAALRHNRRLLGLFEGWEVPWSKSRHLRQIWTLSVECRDEAVADLPFQLAFDLDTAVGVSLQNPEAPPTQSQNHVRC